MPISWTPLVGLVGVSGAGVQQARGQAGEELAAALGAGGGDVAVMPAADGGGHALGARKAHALERGQGLRIVLDAGKDQAAEARRQLLLALEEGAVALVDAFQHLADGGVEAAQVSLAPQGGDLLPVGV